MPAGVLPSAETTGVMTSLGLGLEASATVLIIGCLAPETTTPEIGAD
jgi:hypothetical protein